MGSRIDRYISGLFWFYFVGGLLVFITLFLAIDALSTMVTYKEAALSALIPFYAYGLPEIIYRMAPVACLLATIFTLSTLNRNNELVALFATGMSLLRITSSILVWVFLISIGIFVLSDRVLPDFTKQKNFIFYKDIKKNPSLYSMVRNEKIWYRSKDTIFNIKTLNPEQKEAQGLTLYYFNQNWDLIQMITAKKVQLAGQNWNLFDGSVTLFTEDSSFPLTSQFTKKSIVMSEDAKDLGTSANTADVLSMSELKNFIKRNKEAGLDTVSYEVDYQSKYGFAFAALVMTLVGIPFSVGRQRSGGLMLNMGICLGLVFVYWILYSSALTLGKHGQINPLAAAWVPNIAMGLFGLYRTRKM
ncbi:MAG: LPS export ABC transporter permease LptG [Pseudobdellovibrionaceae bacterium]